MAKNFNSKGNNKFNKNSKSYDPAKKGYPTERKAVYEETNNGDSRFNSSNTSDKARRYHRETGTHTQRYANDPSWYTNRDNTGLAGSYSFFEPIGTELPVFDSQVAITDTTTGVAHEGSGMRLPGIAVIQLQHTIGSSEQNFGEEPGIAAINVGANKLYSDIRHSNSGARNYEKSDLAIYLVAVAEAYSFYGMMCRAYACMRKYSTQNRYLARRLVEALGFDFNSIAYNLPAFKTYINQYAMRLNVLFIPNNWPYFQRRYMLYSHVFRDEPSDKAQLYAFIPQYFLKFGRDTTTGKGQLYAENFLWSAKYTLTQIESLGDSLIADIILDDDFNLMSGDIAKYTSDLFTLPYMAEDYILEFTDDDLVLSQIENLTIEGQLYIPTNHLVVDQKYDANNNDYLEFLPEVITPVSGGWGAGAELILMATKARRLFNIHTPTYDEGQLLDATRLTNMPTEVRASTANITKYYRYISTEVVEGLYFYTSAVSTGSYDFALRSYGISADNSVNGSSSTRALTILPMFKHAPIQPIIHTIVSNNVGTSNVLGYSSNIDNYILLDVSDMKRLHTAALLSLFDVNGGK